jgi:hypothetical protein
MTDASEGLEYRERGQGKTTYHRALTTTEGFCLGHKNRENLKGRVLRGRDFTCPLGNSLAWSLCGRKGTTSVTLRVDTCGDKTSH